MDYKKLLIKDNLTVKETLKLLDKGAERILFVVSNGTILRGVVTDGNIRRYILSNGKLTDSISKVYNPHPKFLSVGFTQQEAQQLMVKNKIEVLPIVNSSGKVVDAVDWTDIFGDKSKYRKYGTISVPVVIMAGGKGQRMDQFSKILPKPLIPIGDKPIIEIIMDKFAAFGAKHFYLTLNYKGEMIKLYFDGTDHPYTLTYIQEKNFQGTAGSLTLLPASLKGDFIVSNCDIMVDVDYCDLLKFHKENNNVLTVVGSIQHYTIPYGIIEFQEQGSIKEIKEKPEIDFTINTGVYVLSKKAISDIPQRSYFDMTDLIKELLRKNKKVGMYPVSQKAYVDIGQWEAYKQYLEKFLI